MVADRSAGDWSSNNHLLFNVISGKTTKLPTPEQLWRHHVREILQSGLCSDLIIVADGVKWFVHSQYFIGGSTQLQEHLFPGGITHSSRPTLIDFTGRFHPMLVDRLIEFAYLHNYKLDKERGRALMLHFASNDDTTAFGLPELENFEFHMLMYGMAEALDHEPLKQCIYTKLVDIFLVLDQKRRSPKAIVAFVNMVYDSTESRKANDVDGKLKALAVAMAFARNQVYDEPHWLRFMDACFRPAFWADFEHARKELGMRGIGIRHEEQTIAVSVLFAGDDDAQMECEMERSEIRSQYPLATKRTPSVSRSPPAHRDVSSDATELANSPMLSGIEWIAQQIGAGATGGAEKSDSGLANDAETDTKKESDLEFIRPAGSLGSRTVGLPTEKADEEQDVDMDLDEMTTETKASEAIIPPGSNELAIGSSLKRSRLDDASDESAKKGRWMQQRTTPPATPSK